MVLSKAGFRKQLVKSHEYGVISFICLLLCCRRCWPAFECAPDKMLVSDQDVRFGTPRAFTTSRSNGCLVETQPSVRNRTARREQELSSHAARVAGPGGHC